MSGEKRDLNREKDFTEDFSMKFLQITQSGNPDEGILNLLEWLGNVCASERSYIFEIYEDETFSNTYEWCDEGVSAQMDMLQKESLGQISWWLDMFQQNKPVIIRSVEDIKTQYPAAYTTLTLQDIQSLISVPIHMNGKIKGFLGIDNPDFSRADRIVPLLFVISNLFSTMMINRDLMDKLDYSDYHDQLTPSFNRNALRRDMKNSHKWSSLGIVYCKILDIRNINSSVGLDAGDLAIKTSSELIFRIFHDGKIYRVAGDEFVVLYPDTEKWLFNELVHQLDESNQKNNEHITFGTVWDNCANMDVEAMLLEAESKMQTYRTAYYKKNNMESEVSIPDKPVDLNGSLLKDVDGHIIYQFISRNYFNLETFFRSMSMADHHAYFGDLVTKQWYISDSMKELMGLSENIVTDLLLKWEEYLPYPEDLELYRNDIAGVMKTKKNVHDLVYRIRDINNNEYWTRCFGLIKWNEDNTKPLFFCGNITKLNYAFVVDPITNFPREKAAIRQINKLQGLHKKPVFVCFRLNEFSEINELRGRSVANSLLKDIAKSLSGEFDNKIQFYRLDGLRFLVIIPEDFEQNPEEISRNIMSIITNVFLDYNLPARNPCVLGIMDNHNETMSAQEIITDVMSLLEIAKKNVDNEIVYSTNTVKIHRERKQVTMELRKDSVDYNNFRSVIQPIVDAKTHKIKGGEMLLRWKYHGKDVSPGFFIPVLEANNLINHVGRGVFQQAVRHCKRINTYMPDFFLDFNVSYNQIYDSSMLPFMSSVIKKWDANPKNLVLELTETHYNDSPATLQMFLDDVKQLGLRMALDDFGVGYSSLEMLLKYPANVVKLDKSLMKKMTDSKEITDFITTIVYACHKFGKLVCVEGVETERELNIVTEAGCDLVQGFYFYKPMELTDLYDLLISETRIKE